MNPNPRSTTTLVIVPRIAVRPLIEEPAPASSTTETGQPPATPPVFQGRVPRGSAGVPGPTVSTTSLRRGFLPATARLVRRSAGEPHLVRSINDSRRPIAER